jgi:hypothetical protein
LSRTLTHLDEENKTIVLCSFKFGQKEHLISLRETGQLYLNPLKFFNEECHPKDPRRDPNENIAHLLSHKKLDKIIINDQIIPRESICGPIKITDPSNTSGTHVFCCTSLCNTDEPTDGNNVFNPNLFSKFGDHCLIIPNHEEFLKRIDQAVVSFNNKHNNIYISSFPSRNIEYVDFETHHGEVGTFRKDIKYQEEKEFRIAFKVLFLNAELKEWRLHEESIFLDLGSLEDITAEIISTRGLQITHNPLLNQINIDTLKV